jgi:hypothetical protein
VAAGAAGAAGAGAAAGVAAGAASVGSATVPVGAAGVGMVGPAGLAGGAVVAGAVLESFPVAPPFAVGRPVEVWPLPPAPEDPPVPAVGVWTVELGSWVPSVAGAPPPPQPS